MSLLYLDPNGFKRSTATAGHAVGDLLLQEVARRLTHGSAHPTPSPASVVTSLWYCLKTWTCPTRRARGERSAPPRRTCWLTRPGWTSSSALAPPTTGSWRGQCAATQTHDAGMYRERARAVPASGAGRIGQTSGFFGALTRRLRSVIPQFYPDSTSPRKIHQLRRSMLPAENVGRVPTLAQHAEW